MKKVLCLLACVCLLFGCADNKVFTKKDGSQFVACPYGWMNQDAKIDGVEYETCTGNVIFSIVFSETIAAPLLLTGLELYEPVAYNEPKE